MRYVLVTTAAFLLSGAVQDDPSPSPIEAYLDLTIARLQLVLDTWTAEGRPPSEKEENALCKEYGISAKEYYEFAGDHRKEIESYLEASPDIRDEIDHLSQQIRDLLQ